jgi:hypothetical protein
MYRNLRALSLSNLFDFIFIRVHLTADRSLEQFLKIYFLPSTTWHSFSYHRSYAYHTLGNTVLWHPHYDMRLFCAFVQRTNKISHASIIRSLTIYIRTHNHLSAMSLINVIRISFSDDGSVTSETCRENYIRRITRKSCEKTFILICESATWRNWTIMCV